MSGGPLRRCWNTSTAPVRRPTRDPPAMLWRCNTRPDAGTLRLKVAHPRWPGGRIAIASPGPGPTGARAGRGRPDMMGVGPFPLHVVVVALSALVAWGVARRLARKPPDASHRVAGALVIDAL